MSSLMEPAEVARLEHEALSPAFLQWLRQSDDLGHEECPVCHPPIYDNGIAETPDGGRYYSRALDCPICGKQIKRAADSLVRRNYATHLANEHNPNT